MIAQQIINGVLASGIYALFAVGFAMIFGILNVLNMTHAMFGMISAMSLAYLVAQGYPTFLALPTALLVTLVVALLVERLAIRPGQRASGENSVEMPLIGTIGASMVIENTAGILFGHRPMAFPFWLRGYFDVGGVLVSKSLLISAGVATVLLVALEFLVNRTNAGRQIRAVALNRNSARIMGINAQRIIIQVMLLSALLSGIAGFLVGMSYGFVSPQMSMTYAIKGLIAMIIGGVGSLSGAMYGAVFLGVVEAVSIMTFGSEFRDLSVFVVLMGVLLLRPNGLIAADSLRV